MTSLRDDRASPTSGAMIDVRGASETADPRHTFLTRGRSSHATDGGERRVTRFCAAGISPSPWPEIGTAWTRSWPGKTANWDNRGA